MRLTDRTDYAFRVLMYLAANGGRDRGALRDIAQPSHQGRLDVGPRRVRRDRARQGRRAASGAAGGGNCRRRGGAVDGKGDPACRVLSKRCGGCRIETCCALKGVLAEAEAAFFAVLDRYSIDDLVRGNRELRAFVLGGPAEALPSDARPKGGVIAPRPSTTGRGVGTRRDRRASADSRSDRLR